MLKKKKKKKKEDLEFALVDLRVAPVKREVKRWNSFIEMQLFVAFLRSSKRSQRFGLGKRYFANTQAASKRAREGKAKALSPIQYW